MIGLSQKPTSRVAYEHLGRLELRGSFATLAARPIDEGAWTDVAGQCLFNPAPSAVAPPDALCDACLLRGVGEFEIDALNDRQERLFRDLL